VPIAIFAVLLCGEYGAKLKWDVSTLVQRVCAKLTIPGEYCTGSGRDSSVVDLWLANKDFVKLGLAHDARREEGFERQTSVLCETRNTDSHKEAVIMI
jgi:hypothetical protein